MARTPEAEPQREGVPPEPEERSIMSLRELVDSLKPYPTLLTILIRTMKDEEFEQYIKSLRDERAGHHGRQP